jgi:hypothetical protein
MPGAWPVCPGGPHLSSPSGKPPRLTHKPSALDHGTQSATRRDFGAWPEASSNRPTIDAVLRTPYPATAVTRAPRESRAPRDSPAWAQDMQEIPAAVVDHASCGASASCGATASCRANPPEFCTAPCRPPYRGSPRYRLRIFATIVNSGSTTFEISYSIPWPSRRLAPRSSNP